MKSIVIMLMSCLVAVTVSAQGIIRRPAATKPKPTVRKPQSRGSSAVRPKPAQPKKADPINSLAEPLRSHLKKLMADMVLVEGGTYMMGNPDRDRNDEYAKDVPHEVTLSSFYICKYEVTEALWTAVMGSNPSRDKLGDNYPVERVNWYDCQDFVEKLSELTGRHFRLPTEAEWEYAARGGKRSRGYRYSGSYALDEIGWHVGNAHYYKREVGTKKPNELGLYDMTGNVSEWCQDKLDIEYYHHSPSINPQGSDRSTYKDNRCFRGGSFCDEEKYDELKVYTRNTGMPPEEKYGHLGLRLAMSVN
ncbi:SUMF1/EgtB/PvdO family nonheme iron enzyme [Prevotella dentalis]|uniref:SUMF1/EgtB/PvdO family nonheme iron enzyme n=1 Tax=Prevotella dentalis TaxID=52227 RepID=UPI0030101806|nr:SUMF1/EgtB/PvdO family nonheme iron enzyme [Prevotella dentalis]